MCFMNVLIYVRQRQSLPASKTYIFVLAVVIYAHMTEICRGQKRLVLGTSELHSCVLERSSPAESCDSL